MSYSTLRIVSGSPLTAGVDDRILRVDWDGGFVEGRQYGRGRSGGQVREEYRADFDAGRGGWGAAAEGLLGGPVAPAAQIGGKMPPSRRQSLPAGVGGGSSSSSMPPPPDSRDDDEPSAKRSRQEENPRFRQDKKDDDDDDED